MTRRDDIEAVLIGDASYDDLDESAQTEVRKVWDQRIAERRQRLNYKARFEVVGECYSEGDAEGNVVVHGSA